MAGGYGNAISGWYTDTVEIYDPGLGTWTLMAPMSKKRWGHTATLLTNGRVLVAGGWAEAGFATGTLQELVSTEVYDPGLDTWSRASAMRTKRVWHSGTLLSDGNVLVAGGRADSEPSATPARSLSG